MNLIEVFKDSEVEKQKDRFYGVAVAVVTNNDDPDKLGRVKVKFPWLSDNNESFWARILTPLAGKGRGFYHLPEPDDEVLVAFEFGDINKPMIIGALWTGDNIPQDTNKGKLSIQNIGDITIESTGNIVIKGKSIDFQKAK